MKYTKRQFVQLPVDVIKCDELKPSDLYIYLIVKSYMNNKTRKCFPSIETLVEKSEISKPTILKSINLLEKNNFIKIERGVGVTNTYSFPECDKFEIFSYEFLNNSDLNKDEKISLISLQHYMFKNKEGEGKILYSEEDVVDKTGLSKNMIKKVDKSLKEKELVTITHEGKVYALGKLGQSIIWNIDKHERQIRNQSDDIYELKDELRKQKDELRKQKAVINSLKKELKDKNAIKNNNNIDQIIL